MNAGEHVDKGSPHSLLVGLLVATATLKIQVENSQKSKNEIYYMTQIYHSLAGAWLFI